MNFSQYIQSSYFVAQNSFIRSIKISNQKKTLLNTLIVENSAACTDQSERLAWAAPQLDFNSCGFAPRIKSAYLSGCLFKVSGRQNRKIKRQPTPLNLSKVDFNSPHRQWHRMQSRLYRMIESRKIALVILLRRKKVIYSFD